MSERQGGPFPAEAHTNTLAEVRDLHVGVEKALRAGRGEHDDGRQELPKGVGDLAQRRVASCGLALRLGFRDPADLAALFDHDITGVDLDSRLDGCFLMPWEHDEPARMGSHACVLRD